MVNRQQVIEALRSVGHSSQRLKRQDFDLSNGVAGARTKIASYQAESPVAFRPGAAVRMVFTAVEEFETSGDGAEEHFDLGGDVLPTANTTDFVLYSEGERTSADAVDYAANSFTYTDGGAAETLHACFVPRDPVEVEVVKRAPSSQGRVEQTMFNANTAMLHERNQHKEPPSMEFTGSMSALAPVVPRKWTVDIYADGDLALGWDDSDAANPQGAAATNAVLSLPVNRAQQDVADLGQAVKESIIDPDA